MKKDIHPTYHDSVAVKCSCGNSFKVGSTQEALTVEVCSNCHPFYTGKQKLVDVGGRIERFKKRLSEAEKQEKVEQSKKPKHKKKEDTDNTVSL